MGTPAFAVPTLERIVSERHEVAGVYTQPDRPKGRGQQLAASPVKESALRLGIEVRQPERIRRPEVVAELAGDRTRAVTSVRIPIRESGWYLLRARGNKAAYPVLDVYPYATTSPIYVVVGGRPIRSRWIISFRCLARRQLKRERRVPKPRRRNCGRRTFCFKVARGASPINR